MRHLLPGCLSRAKQRSNCPSHRRPHPASGCPGRWCVSHTYVYDQILHGQGPGQLGDLIAELVYVLKRNQK